MIKFFRKIRQHLISEGNTKKYLKYAIGEIILVVIGILIALQINNWNSEKNRKKAEKVIIEQLIEDLKKSQVELKEVRESREEQAKASAKVCHAFFKNDVPNDSIYKYMRIPLGTAVYSPTLGTARSIINSGNLTLIRSNDLKIKITAYVETVEYKLKDIDRYEETYFRNGQLLLKEAVQFTNLVPKAYLFHQTKGSDTLKTDELRAIPYVIEKVPFETDLEEIFQNYSVFSAYNSLLVAHRNSAFKYREILKITNELLNTLEEN
ncbi:DUF6090 family protein [Mangrovimonas yunxiaonensis]|uniref:DUF6090 family protein n=1 Tax=Mangrovimonas yunxiaonensis TaxID=1197477 RepID=UPI00103A5972|nr:DUF6090 family protein [Mangrovimonas yunxiaonensis]GGH40934.1 hypothetical protein GCM10011364_11430 [Mangrovimonas yunxiaonensis]